MKHESPAPLDRADFAFIVKHAPLVSIDLIVRNRRGQMPLGYRRNQPASRSWFVPGGSIRKNERIAAAFRRVTLDELGLALPIAAARFVGVFEHLYADNFTGDPSFGTHYVVLAYEIAIEDERLSLPQRQHSEYLWLDDAAILARADVHPNTQAYCTGSRLE